MIQTIIGIVSKPPVDLTEYENRDIEEDTKEKKYFLIQPVDTEKWSNILKLSI